MIGVKWVIYCRVSTGDQTVANQLPACVNYLKNKGVKDQDYIVLDETESTRKTRPVKEHIIKLARTGKIEGVIISRLDRWARSSQELVFDLDLFVQRGITFISVGDLGEINMNSPMGRLQVQILGSLAEFERGLIRQRTLEGLARTKAQGTILGRKPGSKDKKKRERSCYRKDHRL